MEPSTSSGALPKTQSTTSNESQPNLLYNLPYQDIVVFGGPSNLCDINLPTYRDILKYYFFFGRTAQN